MEDCNTVIIASLTTLPQDLLAHRAQLAHKVLEVFLAWKEMMAFQVLQEFLDTLEIVDQKVLDAILVACVAHLRFVVHSV
ncbi:UNVERIFIED_CONTAM: hypothetical protein K2H54_016529 [Gekko kuhli]